MSIDKINNTKLSEEEKKAINYLTKYINWETFGERNLSADIETVLKLITKLQQENKEKDKQIDLMAEYIHKTGEYECSNIKCEDDGSITCKDCIKQYFERKVKDGRD